MTRYPKLGDLDHGTVRLPNPANPARRGGGRDFVVIRINRDPSDTYAVPYDGDLTVSIEEALDLALPDPGDTVEFGFVVAKDAGAARLMTPGADNMGKRWSAASSPHPMQTSYVSRWRAKRETGVVGNPSWSQGMAAAYSRGILDGKHGTPSNASAEEYRACYEQGYAHGRSEQRGLERHVGLEFARNANPPSAVERGPSALEHMLDGMARALWVTSWADWVDEDERRRKRLGPGPGEDYDDYAPPTPRSAEKAAGELYRMFSARNTRDLDHLLHVAAEADWRDGRAKGRTVDQLTSAAYAESFGHYMAMQALGHGVSWFDDHAVFPIRFPYFHAYTHNGKTLDWSPRER